jgi:hypothetical protein
MISRESPQKHDPETISFEIGKHRDSISPSDDVYINHLQLHIFRIIGSSLHLFTDSPFPHAFSPTNSVKNFTTPLLISPGKIQSAKHRELADDV